MATRRDDGPGGGTDVLDRTVPKTKTKRPPLHKVVLYNDDVSMPDNVAKVLRKVFAMGHGKAWDVMMEAHTSGKALCGVFPFEVAETKVMEAMVASQELGEAIRFEHEPE